VASHDRLSELAILRRKPTYPLSRSLSLAESNAVRVGLFVPEFCSAEIPDTTRSYLRNGVRNLAGSRDSKRMRLWLPG
jgi:hypothetical protein